MNAIQQAIGFIDHFVQWAAAQSEILAVALVGSHARNAAREDSDVDLVIITDEPQKYLAYTEWTGTFGIVAKQQREDYGRLTSLRVWYQNGLEVEYGITTRAWAQIPLDEGKRQVIENGMRVLFERAILLSLHETLRAPSTR